MSAAMNRRHLLEVARQLGLEFERLELLEQALTHKSFANESPPADGVAHNERLEFLGDAVLNLVVGEMLMSAHPEVSEGHLSRMRAALVNGDVLAQEADRLGLGEALRLGRGEEQTGGRAKGSILADVFEAVVAAVYLDSGIGAARKVIANRLGERIEATPVDCAKLDPKSRLQEFLQANGNGPPDYVLVDASGPDHDRRFRVEARSGDRAIGVGLGRNKKLAEQVAAADALDRLAAWNGAREGDPEGTG